jgi:4-hydroxythreonine-4-phosphate dehydrogenase
MDTSPIIAVTMGDPAGIGPEIVAKAWRARRHITKLVCVGDFSLLSKVFVKLFDQDCLRPVQAIGDARFRSDALDVLDLNNIDLERLVIGQSQASAGHAAYEYIVTSVDLALKAHVDAIVTAPINKEAMIAAGHHYQGHTEIVAEKTGSRVTMMLVSGDFRVSHVSTHLSLKEAIAKCKKARILEVIELTDQAVKKLGVQKPRLGVAGLNPHAGEGGLFGDEEIEEIQPAIDEALRNGIVVYPHPIPGDAVVAQYHDQGHIPTKLLDFFGGVNITMGAPIIRTSVDHGTAFDIAGKGIANENSLINAIELAEKLAGGPIVPQSS